MIRQLTDPRELRGLAILSQPDTVIQTGKDEWDVRSQSIDAYYHITRSFQDRHAQQRGQAVWTCTCPDFQKRHMPCKHIHAIQLSLKIAGDVQEQSAPAAIEEAEPKILCPECKSVNVIKWGIRKTTYGENQRFRCHNCGHRFVVDKGFCRMKNSPKTITLTLDLYFKGVSQRKIVDHLKQFEDVEITQPTILSWIKKYLKLLAKYSEKYKADVGNIWHCDETTVFIKKEGEKKYYEWIWNLMDAKTRYLLACQVSETRYVKDARKPLSKAKEITTSRPDAIVTDGLPAYSEAIKAEYYGLGRIQNPHVRLKDFETKPNNNILERLNGTFRERTKVMRSLDSAMGAEEFATGMQTYYNYIRPHQGIGGMVPAQLVNIPINLSGNRWETMIGLAIK
ncbi:MAG: DDE-type integrase/transposase/recombinase [Methanoregula sp.]|jgi:transposase-like protein/DNA-directed RNA polymerase subunit M/transcription elongation factor TFIIS|uniref:DDE-type integrase/transposase/recombinase n=1 Tax=Methanoregula sp. TaxID=2052170 RepID=UPI003D09AD95